MRDRKNLVWVQCQEHSCLAYLDERGKWINFYTGKGLKELCQRDRMIRSGSMCNGIFHKQHKNQYKNRAPSPRNKPFEFFNFYFHFVSFESAMIDVLTAIASRIWRNSDANRKGWDSAPKPEMYQMLGA